ncbi:MAG: TonB-dependent receptor [Bacteroidetes bacterium]|nr:TonB-dependent receptor [Bacteroidota bacterium]
MSLQKGILFISFFFSSVVVFSQNRQFPQDGNAPAIGKIKGIITDSKTKQTVEFATIALYKMKDSSLVNVVVAGSKGEFLLSELPFGRYFMKINFIGYKQLVIDTIAIRPRSVEIDLGQIKLKSNTEQLNEVEVSSDKNTFQMGIDRKIFNVEKSIVSEGGSATDVLQSIPSVSVDIDGNISLRGSGNVTVLVDGKPSGITGSSRAAILQQIPASSIESIELITNPSAKYDPDGMSGIINIITKKNKLNGFNGSVSAGVGTGDKYNASGNISYRNSKINVYANYGFRSNNRTGSGLTMRKNLMTDTTFYLRQNSSQLNKNISHNVKAGMDFYLNDKNTLGFSVLYNTGTEKSNEEVNFYEADNNDVTSASYSRDNTKSEVPTSMDYNINYRKSYTKPKQELVFDATYSDASGKSLESFSERDYALKYYPKNSTPFRQNTDTKTKNTITSAQVDYVQPLKNQMKLELGAKTTLRMIGSDFVSEVYNYTTDNFVVDSNLSNNFIYTENIYAAYSTFSGAIKSFGYQLGLRAEDANTISNSVTANEKYTYNYFNLFPSVHLSQKLKKEQELQISYSRRINRPNTRSLNPFRDYSDPYNIRFGNPYLKPEYINSYELSYLKYFTKGVLTSTLYFRETDGVMQRYKILSDSTTSFNTFINLNKSQSYGVELILKEDITKWWNITFSANGFETKIDGSNVQGDLQNENLSYIIKLLSNMRVWKNMDIQFTANYNGPTATLQGEVNAMFSMDLGLKKEIFKNATLSLNINDLTDSRKMAIIGNNDPTFYLEMTRKRESRIATLTFSYRFGKMSETKKSRSDKQNNGGGDNGGGDIGM